MNVRLAQFLISLARDPDRLSTFNNSESGREAILSDADLADADKAALRSDDAAEVLRRMQAGEDDGLTWVISPGVKKFTVGVTIPSAQSLEAPGVKSLNAPGVKSLLDAPGVKSFAAPGVKSLDAPGVKAVDLKGAGAKSGRSKSGGAKASGKKKPGSKPAAPAKRTGNPAARGSKRKPRR